jgi:FkbM family methyltransferase
MLKNLARKILFRDSSRRILGSRHLQPIWESIHKLSLYGMNYGGNVVECSGEFWVLEWLRRRYVASQTETPALILDVGAHDGSYSLQANKIFGGKAQIHSFEPSEGVYTTLRRATANYPNIAVHHCGMSDRESTASLYYDAVGSQKASIHADAYMDGAALATGAVIQGQRISISLNSQHFREEVCVHHAANHLSTKAVFDGMSFEKAHCEAS